MATARRSSRPRRRALPSSPDRAGRIGPAPSPPDFAAQVTQAYANLGGILDALGARPEHVLKLTVFVVDHDMSKLGVLTEQVTSMFGAALPAQTLVPVPKLAVDGMLFEVEATAVLA